MGDEGGGGIGSAEEVSDFRKPTPLPSDSFPKLIETRTLRKLPTTTQITQFLRVFFFFFLFFILIEYLTARSTASKYCSV